LTDWRAICAETLSN